MHLEEIDTSLIQRAIGTFLTEAWGDLAESHWPKIDFAAPRETVLGRFTRDQRKGRMRAYALRLGNRRYPFMKLVLEELLIRDVFFFAVDTHDELDIKETTPDYAEWVSIREFNARVKKAVEGRWRDVGVPTCDDVLESLDEEPVPDDQVCDVQPTPRIHVVDDEEPIALGVRRILEKRGYDVAVSHSGEEALDAIKRDPPDLVLSDLEMGGMTGLELCHALRRRPEFGATPFILATAAGVDSSRLDRIDAFLVKPYEIETLVKFVHHHLDHAAGR